MKIKVASVQMISLNNDYEGNRSRAEEQINEAIRQGARLILLPEFALVGYCFEDSIWEMSEPLKGRTYRWLDNIATNNDVYIGTCILETDGTDFFDTFILVGPGEFFFHRKIEPASYEAFEFKGQGLNDSVFASKLGRIGVAVCFDTTMTHTLIRLLETPPDIMLITYSSPELPWFCLPGDRRIWLEEYKKTPGLYASYLKCPVVVSNKTGQAHTRIPLLPGFLRMDVKFTQGSCILDGNNKMLKQAKDGQGVIVEVIETERTFSPACRDLKMGRWLIKFSPSIRITMDMALRLGSMRYHLSRKRKKAAQSNYQV